MQKMRAGSLGWEDLLEKGMATQPVFLPRESNGQRSLEGYSLWGCKESDMTEHVCACAHTRTHTHTHTHMHTDTPVLLPAKFHGQRSLSLIQPLLLSPDMGALSLRLNSLIVKVFHTKTDLSIALIFKVLA